MRCEGAECIILMIYDEFRRNANRDPALTGLGLLEFSCSFHFVWSLVMKLSAIYFLGVWIVDVSCSSRSVVAAKEKSVTPCPKCETSVSSDEGNLLQNSGLCTEQNGRTIVLCWPEAMMTMESENHFNYEG